jgi:hypothetical protein
MIFPRNSLARATCSCTYSTLALECCKHCGKSILKNEKELQQVLVNFSYKYI